MDKKMRQSLILIAFGIILFAAVMNLNYVILVFGNIVGMIVPILAGFIIAFVLSVPMNGFEKIIQKLFRKAKHKPGEKAARICSLLLTLMMILLVIFVTITTVVPEIMTSVKSIGVMIQEKWPQWALILKSYDIDTTPITDWMENLEFEHLFTNLVSGAGAVLDVIAGTAASTISIVVTTAISIVIMFYVLLSKKDLERQSKKILYAYLKKERADWIVSVASLVHNTYTKFLSGQCVEAVILGLLMFVAFCIFRLPYAGLVAMLTGVCAFVPYIGAFFSCGVGVLLTLIANPSQAILCFVVYQVVQFIENQFIYPHVVGNSVGLSPLWTLMAVLIGGKLFGLIGMIFFIPLVAVIYTLVREHTNKKLKEKKILIE